MEVEKVNSKDIDLKAELETAKADNKNLEERMKALEDMLNEKDMIIYNLAIKIAKL